VTAAGDDKPLAGRRVLVTRSADQSAGLVERLRERGAEVIEVPLLAVAPPENPAPFADAIRGLDAYDWLVLTSANAAHAVADAIRQAGARLPKTLRLASSGPATTAVIRSLFPGTPITAQATSRFGSPGLAEALRLVEVKGSRILLPVSDRSPAAIGETLRERGAIVDVVVAYRTVTADGSGPELRAALAAGLDVATFASPSAVEAFVHLSGGRRDVPAVVIGPTTAAAARARGLAVLDAAEAETADGLAEAVEKSCSLPKGRKSP
jgi:uroporphyrinogen III methyltransferase/synthase